MPDWEVEFSDKFGEWWDALDEDEQVDVSAAVELLEREGPFLAFPFSSKIQGSRYGEIRELRIQHAGDPYRVLYAFDPRRIAFLLLGGNKGGEEKSWYRKNVPVAEKIYKAHLETLRKEANDHGPEI